MSTHHVQITLAVALAVVALCTAVPTGGYGSSIILGGLGGLEGLGSLGGLGGLGKAESYSSLRAPVLVSSGSSYEKEPEIIAYPKYAFKYGVEDSKTGDYKDQAEERDGDVVKGEYTLLQPDGRRRVVKYQSDKKNGFNAIVSYSGHAVHPQEVKQVVKVASLSSYGGGLSSY